MTKVTLTLSSTYQSLSLSLRSIFFLRRDPSSPSSSAVEISSSYDVVFIQPHHRRLHPASPSLSHPASPSSSSSSLAVFIELLTCWIVPRSLSQLDLEKFLATSKKTQVAAGEYCGLRGSIEPDEMEAAISGISKLLV
ncbi:hypothetical protein Bca4012_058376 [Brassica carinata]